jgi:hypothetical protein
MRILFILPVINLLVVSNYSPVEFLSAIQSDTTSITHMLDGNIGEWPTEKFTTDKTTKIRYAVDNDSQTLFLAINIPAKSFQQKGKSRI